MNLLQGLLSIRICQTHLVKPLNVWMHGISLRFIRPPLVHTIEYALELVDVIHVWCQTG
jgi:hypothetical protein